MLAKLFQRALRLYPREYRQQFGAEMIDVFEQARQDARAQGRAAYIRFCVREMFGLAGGVAGIRLKPDSTTRLKPDSTPESWIWSLEAPVIVVALYALGVEGAHEFGLWGFFYPATIAVAFVAIAGLAWIGGRACTLLRPRRFLGMLAAGVVLALFIVPASLLALEDARAERVAAFLMPGIQVTAVHGASAPSRTPGLTFTRTVTTQSGSVTLVHHRNHDSPPYLVLGGLLAGVVALASRRIARRAAMKAALR